MGTEVQLKLQCENFHLQECIPVGCVPPASVVIFTGGGIYLGVSVLGVSVQGVSRKGCVQGGCREDLQPLDLEADTRLPHCMLGYTPAVDRQTPVKILPCPKLCLQAVNIMEANFVPVPVPLKFCLNKP